MRQYRRLPLAGLSNARELGGYPFPGGVTTYGAFIRSEIPARLTQEDILFLRDYGVRMVIDFRSGMELEKTPCALAGEPWLEYRHIPAFDEMVTRGAIDKNLKAISAEFSWGHHYIDMAEGCKGWIKSVLDAMADCDGAVLYHCTTGKDRTGIITAMLLGSCGVDEGDIVADYCVSQIYLREMYKTMTHLMPKDSTTDMSDPFFSTAPENMLMLLNHLDERYGGIAAYLEDCGVSGKNIERLKGRLQNLS